MYFIELLVKNFFKKEKSEGYDPLDETDINADESEYCEHVFMPLDSTGENLACTKCGLVVKKSKLKKKNIFKRN